MSARPPLQGRAQRGPAALVLGNDQDSNPSGGWHVKISESAGGQCDDRHLRDLHNVDGVVGGGGGERRTRRDGAERNGLDLYARGSGPSGEDLSGRKDGRAERRGPVGARMDGAAAGDCPYVDGEAGACVATAVDACA